MKCHYCKRRAEYLCDFVLEAKTNKKCDRPLCSRHRHFSNWFFWCGKDGGMESVDYCPGHVGAGGRKPPNKPIRRGGGRGNRRAAA